MKKYEGLNEAMVKHIAPQPGRRALLPPLVKSESCLMCRMLLKAGMSISLKYHSALKQRKYSAIGVSLG